MSKKHLILVFILVIYSNINFSQNINLMPLPNEINLGKDKFIIENTLKVELTNKSSEKIKKYTDDFINRISVRTGIFFEKDIYSLNSKKSQNKIIISYKNAADVVLGIDESYSINIKSEEIFINSITDIGAMRALETLYQLMSNDSLHYYFPESQINDSPRYKWRGLMIDVSRHFMPVDVIKRNINGMALVKMNVLHLHLSDNQSVRVESKIFPQIQEKCSNGEYFTQEQLKEIVEYAKNKGIRVIPEFDIPWHTTAWFAAFPNLASKQQNYELETEWGVFDPVFNPTIEETYDFFDKFFGEMSTIFTDEYFHIGGDEGTDKHWLSNKQITDFMIKNNMKDIQSLHNYFNLRILKILEKYNKKMIGWDEIFQPEMPNNIVIQSWRGHKSLIESANKGYKGILSNGYYIDLIQPTDYHYLNDPIPDSINLSPEARENILGGEATMWSELVTYENIDSRIWPRTAAIAERFWSKSSVKDVDYMYKRLDYINNLLENVGVAHIKNIDMMIRRLCNFYDVTPLKTLLEVVEPLKGYSRHSKGVKYTTYSPYSRVVDVAIPDVKKGRELKNLINHFVKNPNKDLGLKIIEQLKIYSSNTDNFVNLSKKSPILAEINPLVYNLDKLCKIGVDLITLKIENKPLDQKKKITYSTLLKEFEKSYGQVEIVFVKEIENLLDIL